MQGDCNYNLNLKKVEVKTIEKDLLASLIASLKECTEWIKYVKEYGYDIYDIHDTQVTCEYTKAMEVLSKLNK